MLRDERTIEKSTASRGGLKCAWRLVREKNNDRLVATWINLESQTDLRLEAAFCGRALTQ